MGRRQIWSWIIKVYQKLYELFIRIALKIREPQSGWVLLSEKWEIRERHFPKCFKIQNFKSMHIQPSLGIYLQKLVLRIPSSG